MILNASYNSHRISEEGKLDQSKMADDLDVDDLLEAPYKVKAEDTEVGKRHFLVCIFSVILVDWR